MNRKMVFPVLCFWLLGLISFSSTTAAQLSADRPFPVFFSTEQEVIIDGCLADWPSTIPFMLASDTQIQLGSSKGYRDFSGTLNCFFDRTNIYFNGVIKDRTPLINDFAGNDIYQGDCLEIYLGFHEERHSAYSRDDVQFGFSLTREEIESWNWTRSVELTDYDLKICEIEGGYRLEGRAALANFIDRELQPGEKIWLDFALDNNTGGRSRNLQLVWYGDETGWQTPKVWRQAVLTAGTGAFSGPFILGPPEYQAGKSHRVYLWYQGKAQQGKAAVGNTTFQTDSSGGFLLNLERAGRYRLEARVAGQVIAEEINLEKEKIQHRISFPVREIKVNQLGYETTGNKYFLLTDNDGKLKGREFRLVPALGGECVYTGQISGPRIDPATGDNLYVGDFSGFRQEGRYKVRVEGFTDSYVFRIDSRVSEDLFYQTARSYYFQHCGAAVNDPVSGVFHGPCHLEDGYLRSNPEEQRDVTGGWHDAGDYGKYVPPAGVTAAQLVLIKEFAPGAALADLGIPDLNILGEIRYELDWLLRMQDTDGGVFHKVNSRGFPAMILPEGDESQRFIYGKGTAATAIFAGALAAAARVFAEDDPDYARQLRQAAVRAGEFLCSQGILWPEKDGTGEYRTTVLSDELFWAYAALYRLTGREDFLAGAVRYVYYINDLPPISWDDTTTLGIYDLLKAGGLPGEVREKMLQVITRGAQRVVNKYRRNGYGVALGPDEYYWASNKIALANGLNLLLAREFIPDEGYQEIAARQLDYVLGVNALSKSYLTGIGTDRVRYPHHRLVIAGEKMLPGLLVGGPNNNAEDGYYPAGLGQRGYVDISEAYSCNEYAIDYNAPLVFLAAYFRERD